MNHLCLIRKKLPIAYYMCSNVGREREEKKEEKKREEEENYSKWTNSICTTYVIMATECKHADK